MTEKKPHFPTSCIVKFYTDDMQLQLHKLFCQNLLIKCRDLLQARNPPLVILKVRTRTLKVDLSKTFTD